jgi:hypothetical protein
MQEVSGWRNVGFFVLGAGFISLGVLFAWLWRKTGLFFTTPARILQAMVFFHKLPHYLKQVVQTPQKPCILEENSKTHFFSI